MGYSPRPLTMQVMLRIPLQLPGGPVRFEFAVFGGSFMDPALRADIAKCGPTTCDRESGEQRPCSDYAVRIGLTVHPDGRCAACWVAAPAVMHTWQRRARNEPQPPRGGQKPGQVASALSADGARRYQLHRCTHTSAGTRLTPRGKWSACPVRAASLTACCCLMGTSSCWAASV